MTCATRLTQVRDRREHCAERTGLGYHQAPPAESVVGHVRDAGQAQPHLEYNPVSDIPHRGPDFGEFLSVKPFIPLAQELEEVLVLVGQIQHHEALPRDVQHMNPNEVVKHPACRWSLATLALLVWKRRAVLLERAADAVLSGRIDEQADGHHPQQGHDTLRYFEIQRRGEKLGIFKEAEAALGIRLPFVSGQDLSRWQLDLVAFVRREDETTVLVDTRLTGRDPRRQD